MNDFITYGLRGDIHFIYIEIAADIIFDAYSVRLRVRVRVFVSSIDAMRSATMIFPLNTAPIQTSGWISMIDKEKSTSNERIC